MKRILERLGAGAGTPIVNLTLPLDGRRKSRQRVRLDGGEEAALVLPRGTVLRDGDRLRADDGAIVGVRAAVEALSEVRSEDALALARAAYHLGNRHVPVEIAAGRLRYHHDHVLDDMVRALGMEVGSVEAAFEPEVGPYQHEGTHHHDHGHEHDD